MNHLHRIATVGLLLAAFAGGASAQSAVSLSGVVDSAARRVANDGSNAVKSLVSGSNSTSRLVFRGSEDLGDGLGASFWLESGIALDSGSNTSSTQFFDRRATLSLSSSKIGEFRMGRDYVPTYLAWVRHDPFSHVGVAGSNNFASSGPVGPIRAAFSTNANTTVRASNTIQLLLPTDFGGFEGAVMAGAGEGGSAAGGQARLLGGRIGYAMKPFGIVAATARTTNDLTGRDEPFKDHVIGGNLAFDAFRFNLAWRRFDYREARQTNLIGSAVWTAGRFETKLSVLKGNLSGRVGNTVIDDNDALQVGLGTVYSFSRRTAVYATVSRIDNDGRGNFVIPGGGTLTAGGRSTGVEAGLRHNF